MSDTSRTTTAKELADTLTAFRDSLWACHESEPGSPISLEPSAASTLHNALHNAAAMLQSQADELDRLSTENARLRGIEERAQSAQKRLCGWPHNKSRTARVLRRILHGEESV